MADKLLKRLNKLLNGDDVKPTSKSNIVKVIELIKDTKEFKEYVDNVVNEELDKELKSLNDDVINALKGQAQKTPVKSNDDDNDVDIGDLAKALFND